MKTKAPQHAPRQRRVRTDIREALLNAALVEFGAKGFDGASTRAIAARVDAHQPQINYHFESKMALWTAAVDHLFALLGEEMAGLFPTGPTNIDAAQLAVDFADGIRRFVAFAARHPELNQIMVHEGTADSDRLAWLTKTHVKPLFDAVASAWTLLREAGVAAPIDSDIVYYLLVGGHRLPTATRPRCAFSPDTIRNHLSGYPRTRMP